MVTTIVTTGDVARWLRDESLADSESLHQVVALTNELLTEEWAAPVDPAPAKIRLLALNVAARAWTNDPSRSNVESVSRSVDDASLTERYRAGDSAGLVFLTDAEKALLNGRTRSNSVRLTKYGQA